MNTSILVLLIIVVLFYLWNFNNSSNSEAMTMLRYRPFMTGNPAPLDFDENIAGLPNYNSTEVLPNVNQYANNLAFNPNNPNSANLMQNGRSIMNPNAYQYLGDKDGETSGRNSN
jgi:hypothetical protein